METQDEEIDTSKQSSEGGNSIEAEGENRQQPSKIKSVWQKSPILVRAAIIAGGAILLIAILGFANYFGAFGTRTITVKGASFKMIKVKANKDLGINNYWMGETEVTVGLWNAVMNVDQQKYLNSKDIEDVEKPKTGVSWYDTQEFIAKLNKLTGYHFSLQTGIQWLNAATCGSLKYKYTAPKNEAWHYDNSGGRIREVALLSPNAFGIYDLYGNAQEWAQDRYEKNDSTWMGNVLGGNSSDSDDFKADQYTETIKSSDTYYFGFRLVCDGF
ncbi:MAG: SUMF1/EgtB/PvdO family nonheme iron enzyme [Paludibacteraceae bacterium]|jgi:formylglycine-generating enzyme required for sulfatase activity|nr:SUMF1/EgtB/PvdO family nonheme iron enzyme [Paludibacteraceae bacterium]